MKNLKLVCLACTMLFLGYFVRKNYLNWSGPSLELVNDLYDFGNIEEGSNAQHYIKFRNKGLLGLKLTDVSSDCGCTVVDWGDGKVSSGAIDSVLVEYDTNKVGLINRIVTFNSNDADSPHAFYLIGNVMPKDSVIAVNSAEDGTGY